MKHLAVLFISGIVLIACESTTRITGSWVNTDRKIKTYGSVFVTAFSGSAIAKSTVEANIAEALNRNGIKTMKSMDEFPPTFLHDSTDRRQLMNRVREKEMESILVISLIKKETESRYIPGGYAYRPIMYPYYGHMWDYYGYWYPRMYNPGYYVTEQTYFMEMNFYDSKTEELVWSAQSETYDPSTLNSFSKDLAQKIVDRMKQDGLLKPQAIAAGS